MQLFTPEHANFIYSKLVDQDSDTMDWIFKLLNHHETYMNNVHNNPVTRTSGRIKSPSGFKKTLKPENLKSGIPDFFDIVGYKTLVRDSSSIFSIDKEILSTIDLLENDPRLSLCKEDVQTTINHLKRILDFKKVSDSSGITQYNWDDFYPFENQNPKNKIATFYNTSVLLVRRTDVEIEKLKNIAFLPKDILDDVTLHLNRAKSATDYGTANNIFYGFIDYVKKYLGDFVDIDERRIKGDTVKNNGFAQSSCTFYLLPDYIPIEYQIRTIDNERIATLGTASHSLYKPELTLKHLPVNVNSPHNYILNTLNQEFTQDYIDKISDDLPKRFSLDKSTEKLDIYSEYRNFRYRYHLPHFAPKDIGQSDIFYLEDGQKQFYELGLLLDVHGRFDHNINEYNYDPLNPYDVRPHLESQIRKLQQERIDTRLK